MIYLGTLGRMVPLKCPTAQLVTSADRHTFSTTLGGKVKSQATPAGRREWDIGLGSLSTPSEVGTLMDFANGAWGSGPFWFVSVDAPIVNMLTPAAANLDPDQLTLRAGTELLGFPPMSLGDDGFAARSIWTNGIGAVTIGGPVPVIPGRFVTGSAWTAGAGRMQLVFLDANGVELSSQDSDPVGWSNPQRIALTAKTPRTASAVQLKMTGPITQLARPAVTWTSTVYEWGDGQGCDKAIVRSVRRDLVKAWDNPRTGRWSDMSFIVQEVG